MCRPYTVTFPLIFPFFRVAEKFPKLVDNKPGDFFGGKSQTGFSKKKVSPDSKKCTRIRLIGIIFIFEHVRCEVVPYHNGFLIGLKGHESWLKI